MSELRQMIMGAMLATVATVGGASADVIRPKGKVALGPVPAAVPSGPGLSGEFVPGESMLGSDWRSAFRQPLPFSGLVAPSLAAGPDHEFQMGELARPELPPGPLLGASSERITPKRTLRNPEIASNGETGQNVRIPEPGSITLIVAGIIGLAARVHLRRKLQGRKPEVVPNPT